MWTIRKRRWIRDGKKPEMAGEQRTTQLWHPGTYNVTIAACSVLIPTPCAAAAAHQGSPLVSWCEAGGRLTVVCTKWHAPVQTGSFKVHYIQSGARRCQEAGPALCNAGPPSCQRLAGAHGTGRVTGPHAPDANWPVSDGLSLQIPQS